MKIPENWQEDVVRAVRTALAEDLGSGDITAALIPLDTRATANIITREDIVLCGEAWVNEVFAQVDASIQVDWLRRDGDTVAANQTILSLEGPARSLLSAERCALNFMQLLSGTATTCASYAELVSSTKVKLLDTRKTIPGLRTAQKYAVTCGGGFNHRIGLYDAYLIKENHINACGSIANAVAQAKHNNPGKPVEVEVEDRDELAQALAALADIIMLDNFDIAALQDAVEFVAGRAKLEASGGITNEQLLAIAQTGVDYISIGALTKDCKAVDLSMRFN